MAEKKYKYIFGPVPSRRFGRSLGVDLVKLKTCSLDCLFCQVGFTTDHTYTRREYTPVEEINAELSDWHENGGKADFITLSGSGEPTLHTRFGEVISYVKQNIAIPMLLLTNGTMLHIPEVRKAAAGADIVKTSLSAWDEESFAKINRPCQGVSFEKLVYGEKALRESMSGKLWVEVFLLKGINSNPEQVRLIAAIADEIKPDRVQLNTVARPPADESVAAVSMVELEKLAELFSPKAEIIANFNANTVEKGAATEEKILSMLKRRPCTAAQIAAVFNIHVNEVAKHTAALLEKGNVREVWRNGEAFFQA